MRGIPNRGLVVGAIVMVALALLAVGCGGKSYSVGSGKHKPAAKKAGKPSTMFGTAKVSGVGTVLVDGRGRTVYILTSAAKKNVPCTDASGCTAVWPDLPLPAGTSSAKAEMGANASLLGTMKLSDGETYPTYNGYLLYEYTGDSGSGQANGEGLQSFGGTWYVLNAAGRPVKQSGGGSGY